MGAHEIPWLITILIKFAKSNASKNLNTSEKYKTLGLHSDWIFSSWNCSDNSTYLRTSSANTFIISSPNRAILSDIRTEVLFESSFCLRLRLRKKVKVIYDDAIT